MLGDLWDAVAQPDLSVDLVLDSRSEALRRAQEPGSVELEAFSYGVLLDTATTTNPSNSASIDPRGATELKH